MAEGEFARMQHHLEAALKIGLSMGTAPGGDHDLYALLVDAAAQQRDPGAAQICTACRRIRLRHWSQAAHGHCPPRLGRSAHSLR